MSKHQTISDETQATAPKASITLMAFFKRENKRFALGLLFLLGSAIFATNLLVQQNMGQHNLEQLVDQQARHAEDQLKRVGHAIHQIRSDYLRESYDRQGGSFPQQRQFETYFQEKEGRITIRSEEFPFFSAAIRPDMAPEEKALFAEIAALFTRYGPFWRDITTHLFAVSPAGDILFQDVRDRRNWTAAQLEFYKSPYFRKTVGPAGNPEQKLVWTSSYWDHNYERWQVSALLPIYKEGMPIFTIGLTLRPEFLEGLLPLPDAQNGMGLVYDVAGNMISSAQDQGNAKPPSDRDTPVMIPTDHQQTLIDWCIRREGIPSFFESLIGIYHTTATMPYTGWTMVKRTDANILPRAWTGLLCLSIAMLVACGLLFFNHIRRFTQLINRPLLGLINLNRRQDQVRNSDHMHGLHSLKTTELTEIQTLMDIALDRHAQRVRKDESILALEEDLRAAHQTMEQRIQERTSELKQSSRQKDLLLSIMSHDLKSPLNSIMGFSDMIGHEGLDLNKERTREYGILIHQSARKLLTLLDDLLSWSQLRMSQGDFVAEPIMLSLIIEEVRKTLESPALAKSIRLITDIPPVEVMGDATMIEAVLRNLVSNAIKFTESGGTVIVSINNKSDRSIQIMVKDTGVGISENRLKQLFKPETKTTTKGTYNEDGSGLGLLLCREILEAHGTSLHVSSAAGRGSIFSFTLPLALKSTAPSDETDKRPTQ